MKKRDRARLVDGMPNAKQPRWRAKKSTALAIRLQLAKNEHDESAGSSKARENFAIFVKTKAETKTLNRKIRLRHVRHDPSRLVAREQLWDNGRFTPESGHQLSALGCPLCAKSARRAPPIREAAFASLKAPLRPVRCRLIQWMAMRSGKLRAGEGFFSAIIVKPMLARLKARDYRVPCRGMMFRRMLIW
jgi:hypothetical protein